MRKRSVYMVLFVAMAANLAQVGTHILVGPLVPRSLTDFAVSRTLNGNC